MIGKAVLSMYRKQFYVFRDNKPILATIRNYTPADFNALILIQQECFPPPFPSELWWSEEQLISHVKHFPEGTLCIEVDGRLVGSMTSLLVDFDPDNPIHTWEDITDNGYIRTHDPNGDTLYIVDLCVSPAYRSLGLGKWLMLSMYEIVIEQKRMRLLGGSRMPNYHHYAEQLTPEAYIESVVLGEIHDQVISFLLRCGRMPIQVVPHYLEDEESHHYGVLMEWRNPFIQIKETY